MLGGLSSSSRRLGGSVTAGAENPGLCGKEIAGEGPASFPPYITGVGALDILLVAAMDTFETLDATCWLADQVAVTTDVRLILSLTVADLYIMMAGLMAAFNSGSAE